MGLLSGLLGHASEVDAEKLEAEFETILISGEQIEKAFKLVRDVIVFTSHRVIFVDKQGVTGKKTEYISIPYGSITRFSKESAGHLDLESELKIWVRSEMTPIESQFQAGQTIDEAYRTLSEHVLRCP